MSKVLTILRAPMCTILLNNDDTTYRYNYLMSGLQDNNNL